MALRALELGEANDDNLAELAGHLHIAVYLPCEAKTIDEGRRAIRRLIEQWQNGLEYDASDVETVGIAIREYHRIASNISKQKLQKAIQNVLKGVKK